MKSDSKIPIHSLVFTALMAAIVFAMTMLYVPLGGSRVHFGNAASLLAGLLLGPWYGGAASGIGAFLFDLIHGYGILEALVTLVSKFLMAMAAGLIAHVWREEGNVLNQKSQVRMVLGCIIGAITYMALYMLKTYIKQRFIASTPLNGTLAVMVSKLPATAINNAFAAVVAPLLYTALRPALNATGILKKIASGK